MAGAGRTKRPRSLRRALTLLLTALAIPVVVVVPAPTPAGAAVIETFSATYDDTVWGDYLLIGNSQVECITAGTADRFDVDDDGNTTEALGPLVNWTYYAECAADAASNASAQVAPNDSRFMVFSRTDTSTAGIHNSSDVTITIPAGADVAFARLFWHGNDIQATSVTGPSATTLNGSDGFDGTPGAAPWPSCQAANTPLSFAPYGSNSGQENTTNVQARLRAAYNAVNALPRSQMRIRIGGGSYQTINSADEDISPTAGQSGHLYQQEADVTALLDAAPKGTPVTITGANISTGEGFGCTGAWSMVIVYDYPNRNVTHAPDLRRIQIYDGFAEVSSTETVNTTLGGFLASGGGTIEPRVGIVAYEGDQQITGDSFTLEGSLLTEPRATPSATNNYWVSTIGEFTSSTSADYTRSPNHADAAGADIKVVPVSAASLSAAQNGIQASFTTSGDRYTPGVFAFSALAALVSGRIYEDADGDHVNDDGEVGVGGVTVTLTGHDSGGTPVSLSTTSEADGKYIFESVPAADATGYTISVSVPSAYLPGQMSVGSAGGNDGTLVAFDEVNAIQHDLTQQSTGYDYGAIVPAAAATLAKTVYSGHSSGAGCATAGESVTLQPGSNLTYCFTATNTGNTWLNANTLTDAALGVPGTLTAVKLSGATLMAPGGQTVWYVQTTSPATTLTNTGQYTGNPANSEGADLTGRADVSVTDTAQAIVPGRVSLGNLVFVDTDADGVQDGGEPPLAGALVELYDAANTTAVTTDVFGGAVSSVTTGPGGTYSFADLAPGVYTVRVTPPAGYFATATDAGAATEATDSDGPAGVTPNLSAGTSYLAHDIGFVQQSSIAGFVLADTNASGAADVGEPGISGVTVTLTGTDVQGSAVNLSTSTVGGNFSFPAVLPGTYTLTETQPTTHADGTETAGTAGGNTSVNDVISGIQLTSAAAASGYLFADVPGALAGVVFDDLDGDGALDGGEPGIAGVTVTLGGADTGTTTTGADGTYYFAGLAAGTYTLTETQPGSHGDGAEAAGTAGGSAAVNDTISGITLAAGEIATGYLFAEYLPGQLAGTVFEDTDGDGVQDVGEAGITGVTITATGPTATSTMSGPGGVFTLSGLAPGSYTITETQPTSHADGSETAGTGGGSTAVNDVISGILLTSNGSVGGYGFAELPGSLAGVVFDDLDGDGIRDGGEPGIGGVTVTLGGTESATTTSAGDGTFGFTELSAGTYTLTETQPGGYSSMGVVVGSTGGSASGVDEITGVTLAAGEHATGYGFGEYVAVSLDGVVFEDRDGDGVQDGGEPGIAGVTVTLTGTSSASAISAGDGSFGFAGLAPGTYTLTEVQPGSHGDGDETVGSAGGSTAVDDVFSGIVLASGDAGTGYTFGELAGSLAGVVFDDLDGDGVQDGGEPGIAGVTVTLGGAGSGLATTAGDGSYQFANLVAGNYTLTESQPVGFSDGLDLAGSAGGAVIVNDVISSITLTPGVDATGYTFAETVDASIDGVVFEDRDGDGVQDVGEPGIAGVTVTLGGTASASAISASDGSFGFGGLRPGTYSLTETQPVSHGDGSDSVGSAPGVLSANDTVTGIVLASGDSFTGYAFAELTGSLGGVVFDDLDGDGIQDVGEPGIAGVTVTLGGTSSGSTTSAGDGSFGFAELLAGTYTLSAAQPVGYADGVESVGSAGGSTAVNDEISAIVLAGGDVANGYGFAEYVTPSISGVVFEDRDGDGIQDVGEPGIAGVTVTLGGDGTANETTAVDGTYSFLGLAPGTYTVTETQPGSHADGDDTAGTAGGSAAVDDVFSGITIASGEIATGYTFAELAGSLAGVVFDDLDGDGVQDGGEPGIAGVTVDLSGTETATTVTAGDGTYGFANLSAGTYSLTETQPAGFSDGSDLPGSAGGAVIVNDVISSISLAAGDDATGYTFAETVDASIDGVVFEDRDGDGIQDVGEPGVAGVTVTLGGTASASAISASDGSFGFSGLAPGTYTITQTQPGSHGDGSDSVGSAPGVVSTNDTVTGIVLASGDAVGGYTFAELPGSLAGVVFDDLDGDGVQDVGEPGIGGVTVDLSGTETATTVTAGDGTYAFANLSAGTYSLTETQPAGYASGEATPGTAGGSAVGTEVISSVGLGAGQDATGYHFAEYVVSSLSGLVLEDRDGDGIQDGGEPGIGGVTMTLTGPGGPFTTATASDGSYSFTGLAPGTYTLTQTPPTGYLDGPEFAGTAAGDTSVNDVVSAIVLSSGTSATGYHFTADTGSLSGVVLDDLDADGMQDGGEPGLAGVTITLTGPGGPFTTVTASDGTYGFEGLLAGTYTVTETQPVGRADWIDTAGTGGGTPTEPDEIGGVMLAAGADLTGYLFTEVQGLVMSGLVFDDLEGDGVADGGEPGLDGVTLTVTGTDQRGSAVSVTVTTASDGTWSADVLPGTYAVAQVQPVGYVDWIDTPGSSGGITDEPDASDEIAGIVVAPGSSPSGYTFAEVRPASIAGSVRVGSASAGGTGGSGTGASVGVPDVTITLTGTDDRGWPVSRTTQTDGDGDYVFDDLTPGTYTVSQSQPLDLADAGDDAGTGGGSVSNDEITGILLTAGATFTGYTFTEYRPDLGGRVFFDDATDGVRRTCATAPCDDPRPDVVVRLLDPTGTVLATTITGTDGTYGFTDLVAATYRLEFVAPAGHRFTTTDAGTDDTVDSDVDATGHLSVQLTADRLDVDAGIVLAAVDLGITLTQSADRPRQNEPLTYTMTVSNDGPTLVLGPITATITVPGGVAMASVDADPSWTCSTTGRTVSCQRPMSLASGESAPRIEVRTTVTDPNGDLTALATVAGPADDTDAQNNRAEVEAQVRTPGGPLAITGANVMKLLLIGALVFLLGVAMRLAPRRRSA